MYRGTQCVTRLLNCAPSAPLTAILRHCTTRLSLACSCVSPNCIHRSQMAPLLIVPQLGFLIPQLPSTHLLREWQWISGGVQLLTDRLRCLLNLLVINRVRNQLSMLSEEVANTLSKFSACSHNRATLAIRSATSTRPES